MADSARPNGRLHAMSNNKQVIGRGIAVISVCCLLVFAAVSANSQQQKSRTKWEYRYHQVQSAYMRDIEASLNSMGQEGWEISSWNGSREFILKRPK